MIEETKCKEFVCWLKGYIDAKPDAIEDDLIMNNLFAALGVTEDNMWKAVYKQQSDEQKKKDDIMKEFEDKGIQLTSEDLSGSDFFDLEYLSNLPDEDVPPIGTPLETEPEWTEPEDHVPENKIIITDASK